MKAVKKQKQHYVDNQEFLAEITKYQRKVRNAAIKEHPEVKDFNEQQYREFLKSWKSSNRPRVGNYLGSCFLKIATHLSYRPNFINYMYKDDMVCDGIENCIQYIDNFNPEKSNNPFAYFTQIVYYAFLRRIAKEKKQLEIKDKILEKTGYNEVMHVDSDDKGDYNYIKSRIESTSRQISRSNLWKSE